MLHNEIRDQNKILEQKVQERTQALYATQLDVIERCVVLWSNPGEIVLSPFMGVGSEIYGAVELGRKAIGIELKKTYYEQAQKNILASKQKGNEEFQLGGVS